MMSQLFYFYLGVMENIWFFILGASIVCVGSAVYIDHRHIAKLEVEMKAVREEQEWNKVHTKG